MRKDYQHLCGTIMRAELSYLTVFIFMSFWAVAQSENRVRYVQPLSGTAASTVAATLLHSSGTEHNANTIPAVCLPFGMTQWTAQTRTTEIKCQPPYLYKDSLLSGFRGTHWISGSCTQDYGSFTVMPISGKLKTTVAEYAAAFSHKDEVTSPAYYKVNLPSYRITTEITATLRCAMMQFTSGVTDSIYLLITPNSDEEKGFISVDAAKGEVYGYNPVHRIYQGWGQPAGFSGYFVIKIEKQPGSTGVYSGKQVLSGNSVGDEKDIGAYLGFMLKQGEKLRIRIGTSFSSIEGARKNLAAEISNWDFEALQAKNYLTWQKALSQVKVGGSEKNKRIFYTAMYHSMQHPRLYNDVDGNYPQFSGNYQLKQLKKGDYYDDFSMWDIYRAQLPLFEILNPKLVNNFVQSMVLKGQQGDWLPIFPCWNSFTAAMIGDHGTAFIASAFTKGIRDYDVNEAYRLMRKNAFEIADSASYLNGKGRRAMTSYLKYGYIPLEDSVKEAYHTKEQVSRTLEYTYDDYALAMVAKALGKTDDYQLLSKRALNYKNTFDPSVGLSRGRFADGSFYQPFLPDTREFYITEGTPRQYTFYVPHDVPGVAGLMGGRKKLESSLDSLFSKKQYWHGNEPGHQIPFMYNYTSSPWKTQKEVRKVLAEEYSDGPGGLSGNDDAGQMSAWYVFASLGFYPVDPVSNEYLLCSPLFDKATIQLQGAKNFSLISHKQTPGSVYIASIKLNGKVYPYNYIRYADIMKGGTLEFFLKDKPVLNWANNPENQPKGFNK